MTHNLGKGKYKHRILKPGESFHKKLQSYTLDLETIAFILQDANRNHLNRSAYIRKLVRLAHEEFEVCDEI